MDRLRACVRRELVFLALGAMEVCVFTPLLAVFLSQIIPVQLLPVTGLFLGAVLAVHYLARASLRLPLHPSLRSGLLGLGMLMSGLLLVHQLLHAQTVLWDPVWLVAIFRDLQQENLSYDVIVFLLVLFLWWRGLVLARLRIESSHVVSRFRSGLVMLAITTLVGGFILPSPPYQFVFAFFFVSLLGIALARAEEVGQQYEGSQSPFGLGWLVTLVAASLLVLLLAAAVATLLTGENISRFIEPALELQRVILIALTNVLVYVLGWVGRIVIESLFSVFGEVDLEGLERFLAPPQAGPSAPLGQPPFTPDQLALAKGVGVIGGVLLLLLVIAFSLRRLHARAGRRRDEVRESVWEGVQLRRSLRDLLRQARRRLDEAAAAMSRSYLDRLFAARTIRRIYAHMGALAAEQGYPRAFYETPYEYLPTLGQAFPDSHEEVARITAAYVAVHYGQVPERPEDLATIRTAWERIRETAAVESH